MGLWLRKMEQNYGRFAIPNITLYLIICYAVGYFLQIIAPILTGIVMAYLITPIINFLEKKIYGTFFKNKTITPKVKKRVRVVTIIISILLILFLIKL